MSPTEHDLRSALSDGAGDLPDTDRIISAAQGARARRRVRVVSGAATVVLVGAVAVGAALLAGRGGNQPAADRDPGATHSGATHTRFNGGADTMIPATVCPTRVPTVAAATSSAGTLFAKPVATVLVCAYAASSGPIFTPRYAGSTPSNGESSAPTRVQLTGTAATTLTDSLENASRVRPDAMCEDLRFADQRTIAVLARSTDGTQLPIVVTTINEVSCAVVVSNGTTLRYAWTPPKSLRDEFSELSVVATESTPTSGATASGSPSSLAPPSDRVNGSPVH